MNDVCGTPLFQVIKVYFRGGMAAIRMLNHSFSSLSTDVTENSVFSCAITSVALRSQVCQDFVEPVIIFYHAVDKILSLW